MATKTKPKVKTLKVVNTATGEVIAMKFNHTAHGARINWLLLQQQRHALDRLADKLKTEILTMMGDDDTLETGQGYNFRRTVAQRRSYDKSILRHYLNEDELDQVTIPDNIKVKEVLLDKQQAGEITKKELDIITNNMNVITAYERFTLEVPVRSNHAK